MTPPLRQLATRAFVISDLHLGGPPPSMMSQPGALASFVDSLPGRLRPDEQLELVIAGDFVDFLAIEPWAALTGDSAAAVAKLRSVMGPADEPAGSAWPFAVVFDALARHVAAGHALTILVGNHDVELVLPAVQEALLERLGAKSRRVRLVDDGSAYRIGRALIEHGNRYDGANWNDWSGLRALRSASSRGERLARGPEPSAGSLIVRDVVNPLKHDYPFIDLLQPAGELLALLLIALEPSLGFDLRRLWAVWRGAWRQRKGQDGSAPGSTRHVAARCEDEEAREGAGEFERRPPDAGAVDPELERLFGEEYRQLLQPEESVGAHEAIIVQNLRRGSLADLLRRGEGVAVPRPRLERLQALLRRVAPPADLFELGGDGGGLELAAQRIVQSGAADVVVMGHTHLARRKENEGQAGRAWYLNTGTWADVMSLPREALEEGEAGLSQLEAFLRVLIAGEKRLFRPAHADLRVSCTGQVEQAVVEQE